jgi:hypothetical protein
VVLLIARTSRAEVVQLALPFNADAVREPGGTITGGGIDPRGQSLVAQAEAVANDAASPHGLPDNGVLTVPGGTIQLAPYNGNNVLRLGNFGTNGTLPYFIPIGEPGQYDSVEIYAAGAGVNPSLYMRSGRANNVHAVTLYGFDWKRLQTADVGYASTAPLIQGLDTTGPNGAGFENVDDAGIVGWSIKLADPINPVTQLSINGFGDQPPGGQSSVNIFAITLTRAVPEPGTAGLACVLAAGLLLRRRG